MPMRWPEPLDEWAQETYQAFQDALPDGRIGYGCHLPDNYLRALQELAARGHAIELVGYSGTLDYQLVRWTPPCEAS